MVNKMLLQSGKTTSQLYGITRSIVPKCQGLHEEIGVTSSLAVNTNIQDGKCSVNLYTAAQRQPQEISLRDRERAT